MDADPRLAAAAGGVARYLADEAGLESEAVRRLQTAVIEACKEAFAHLAAEHPHLEISFARFSDRLEVSLSHEGEAAPLAGFRTVTRFAAEKAKSKGNSEAFAGVDCVQHETHGKEIVTRLTKYFGKVAPSL
jgi:anti-sigma regulatory factor (Ser/Thr protein kinase)